MHHEQKFTIQHSYFPKFLPSSSNFQVQMLITTDCGTYN